MGLYGGFVVRPPGSASAQLTTVLGSNADLTFTAISPGAGGNAITVEYADPGAGHSPLSVSVGRQRRSRCTSRAAAIPWPRRRPAR